MVGFAPKSPPPDQPSSLADILARAPGDVSDAIYNTTGWRPGTTPSWMPQWLTDLSNANTAQESSSQRDLASLPGRYAVSPDDLTKIMGLAGPLEGVGAEEAATAAPSILSRAEPTPEDIQSVMTAAQQYGRKGWPTAEREVFSTTPEAYGETTSLVPQRSIKSQLPGPLEGEDLPLKQRAAPIVENTEAIASNIAERLDPLVRSQSPLLKFYHTGPVIRGLEQTGGMSLDEANQFMRDWAGQGAATSPRTQTPPNLRNASYLMYQRASGNPLTPERFAAEGNVPGFPMMGMHVNLADLFARGEENPWTNPKPSTFRENWSGNLADVTADTHNIRATLYNLDQAQPGSIPRGWFTSDQAFDKYRNEGFGALDPGDINDSMGTVTLNKIKRQSEYLPMAEPWYRAAEMSGIQPAEAQSGGWFAHGDITNLQSPPKTIVNLLNDQIEATAKAMNVPHEKALEWWAKGKIPLAGVAGAGVAGGLAAGAPGKAEAAEGKSNMADGNMMNTAPNVPSQLAGLQGQATAPDRITPEQLAAARRMLIMRALANQGQRGDTMLAHVNPREAASALRQRGANPQTGLPQFYPDTDDDSLGARDESDVGQQATAPSGGSAIGSSTPLPGSPTTADSDLESAQAAYQKRDLGDKLLGMLGSVVGLEQMKPDASNPASFAGGTYHDQFNPGQLAGSLAGLGAGLGMGGGLGGGAMGALALSKLGGRVYDKLGGGADSSGTTPSTVGPAAGMPTDMSGLNPNVNAAYGTAAGGYPTNAADAAKIAAANEIARRHKLAQIGLLLGSNRSA